MRLEHMVQVEYWNSDIRSWFYMKNKLWQEHWTKYERPLFRSHISLKFHIWWHTNHLVWSRSPDPLLNPFEYNKDYEQYMNKPSSNPTSPWNFASNDIKIKQIKQGHPTLFWWSCSILCIAHYIECTPLSSHHIQNPLKKWSQNHPNCMWYQITLI
jgi:hypothetical protein